MPKETAQSKIKGFILSRSESDPSFGQVAYKTDSFPLDRLGDGVNGVHLLRKDGSLSSTEYGGEVRRIFLKTASGDFYSVYVLTGSFTPVKLWKANESIRITGSDIENTDISPLSGAIVLDSVVEVGKPISYHKLDSKKSTESSKTALVTEIVVAVGYFPSEERNCVVNTEYLDKYKDGFLRK